MIGNQRRRERGHGVSGFVSSVAPSRTRIELSEDAWRELGVAPGERCMVEFRSGDIAAARATEDRGAVFQCALGSVGDPVRVRRPRQ